MNICMIVDSLAGWGTERVVLNLASTFLDQSHNVDIILLENHIENYVKKEINTHVLSKSTSLNLKSMVDQIEGVRNKPFDLILAHGKVNIVKKAYLENVYYYLHNPISKRFLKGNKFTSYLRKKKQQRRYNNENIITVSKGLSEDVLKYGFKPKTLKTIYNPFDFDEVIKLGAMMDKDIPKDSYIINVARFHPQKRQDILLRAFHQADLPCKLVLLGEGSSFETNKILSLIKELKLDNKVILAGHRKNPYPLIKNAALLVLSSDFEGLPTVLIESLILGTPIVSTDCISGPREIMTGDLAEHLVPIRDIQGLSNGIIKAINQPATININSLDRFRNTNIMTQYLNMCKA